MKCPGCQKEFKIDEGTRCPFCNSLLERSKAYKETLRATRNPRAAVRAYAAGNRWAEENAKAVGNW